jgi:hypothetical protein
MPAAAGMGDSRDYRRHYWKKGPEPSFILDTAGMRGIIPPPQPVAGDRMLTRMSHLDQRQNPIDSGPAVMRDLGRSV